MVGNPRGSLRRSKLESILESASVVTVSSVSMGSDRTMVDGGGEGGECKVPP